jgi:hypothetical protein
LGERREGGIGDDATAAAAAVATVKELVKEAGVQDGWVSAGAGMLLLGGLKGEGGREGG